MLSSVHLAFHTRIQDFSSGGSVSVWQKKALTFSEYFTEVKWLISKKTIIFQGSRGGPTFSSGGPTFSRGVQLLIPYRNPYNLWFSRGVRTPDLPLDPHLLSRPAGDSFFPFSRRWVVFFQFYSNFDRLWFCKQTVASGDPTCGSRGGLGGPDPPGKSQVIWVSLDTPTPWKKLDPLLPSVIKPLDPLCKL